MLMSLERLQEVIDACEFDRWMGLAAVDLGNDFLKVRLPFRPEIVGTPKVNRLHGGAIASLIDAVGCYLLIATLNKRVSTVNLVVDYLRPAQGGLFAVARVVKLGRQICNVTVSVTDAEGKEVATGRLSVVPSSVTVGEEDGLARIA